MSDQLFLEELLFFCIAWLILVSIFLHRLKRDHQGIYRELDSPVIRRGGINRKTFAFMILRRHRELKDPVLSIVSDLCLLLFVVILVTSVFMYGTSQRNFP